MLSLPKIYVWKQRETTPSLKFDEGKEDRIRAVPPFLLCHLENNEEHNVLLKLVSSVSFCPFHSIPCIVGYKLRIDTDATKIYPQLLHGLQLMCIGCGANLKFMLALMGLKIYDITKTKWLPEFGDKMKWCTNNFFRCLYLKTHFMLVSIFFFLVCIVYTFKTELQLNLFSPTGSTR